MFAATEEVPKASIVARLLARSLQALCGCTNHGNGEHLVRETKHRVLRVTCLRCGYESPGVICKRG